MAKFLIILATLAGNCLFLFVAGCDDAGVMPVPNDPPLPTILRTTPLLAPATQSTLLTDLYGQGNGSLLVSVGDRINVNGRMGGQAIDMPTILVEPTSTVEQFTQGLCLQPVGVNSVADLNEDGNLTFLNDINVVVEAFSASINHKTAFNVAMSFPSTIGPGLTVNDGVLLSAATPNTRLIALYSTSGLPVSEPFTEDTVIQILGSVGPSSLYAQRQFLPVDSETRLADLLVAIQLALGLETGSVVVDEAGQVVVTGRPGAEQQIGDLQIDANTLMTTLESAFDFLQIQQGRD